MAKNSAITVGDALVKPGERTTVRLPVADLYTGTSLGSARTIKSNDDVSSKIRQSSLRFYAMAGTTYFIAVDGYNYGFKKTARGTIVLTWEQ